MRVVAVRTTTTYNPSTGGLIYPDADLGIRYTGINGRDFGATARVVSSTGPLMVGAGDNLMVRS